MTIRVQTLPAPDAWHLYLVPNPHVPPLEALHRSALVAFFDAMFPRIRAQFPAHQLAGFAQYNQLNRGGAARILADHGVAWGVDCGLGYWPDREPPTLWTAEDFTNLDIGEMPRPMMHQIFGITRGDDTVMEAARLMLGLGPMLLALSADPVAVTKAACREQFYPLIQEPTLRMFAYYYPMLCAAAFAPENAPKLAAWTCGIAFYLRESPDEKGVFIASRQPLDAALRDAGAQPETAGAWVWQPEPAKESK